MSDPLPSRGKKLLNFVKKDLQCSLNIIKNNKFLFIVIGVMMMGIFGKVWDFQPAPYAQAYVGEEKVLRELNSPMFEKKNIFTINNKKENINPIVKEQATSRDAQIGNLEENLLSIVGDTPIREMVPFIAKRDSKVAAFLIGIAKKESSFGLASPSKNGDDCHNYWGYKGTGSRGAVSGYSCFASAQEAIEIVGNRIEVLVGNDRNTPAKMVDTWKCGRSCAGDPGAPGWVSTVATYFDRIVKIEG